MKNGLQILSGITFLLFAVIYQGICQTNWTNVSEVASRTAVCYGNSIFVSAGNNGSVYTSTDGISWLKKSSGVTANLNRVKFGNGLFVAVGETGTIITSPDGNTWTARNSTTTKTLYGIFFANSTFVAVGDNMILTSPNGTSWTANASIPAEIFIDVTYGNSLFVATCFSGKIFTSANGTSWTERVSNTTNFLYSIVYQNSTFVAVGNAGTIVTSTNGTAWTTRTSGTASALFSLAYGSSNFVAGAADGGIFTSPDGETWTPRTSGVTSIVYGLAFGNSTFAGVGLNGVSITSPTGTTWTSHQSGFSMSATIGTDIIYNGQFVGLTDHGMVVSSDAATWTLQSGYSNAFVSSITSNNTGKLFGVTSTGNVLASTASSQWGSPTHISGQAIYDIVFSGSRFVATANFGLTYTSTDGATWTPGNLPGGSLATLSEVEFLNGAFVALGTYPSLTIIVTSTDGVTWTQKATINSALSGISYGGGVYAAVGESGSIYTSTDLVTWTPRTSGTAQALSAICRGYGYFVAVGNQGVILTSLNGETWTPRNSNTTNNLYKVVSGGSSFAAIGSAVLLTAPADSPLPVKLISFNTKKEGQMALLTWATSSETNSDRFEIERSANGKLWQKIGETAASRESEEVAHYNYADVTPLAGQNLYRLKAVDRDDTFTYSQIRSLQFDDINGLSVYPNPASDRFYLTGNNSNKLRSVEIMNLSGKKMGSYEGSQLQEININNLPSGIYIINIITGDGTGKVEKLVKY